MLNRSTVTNSVDLGQDADCVLSKIKQPFKAPRTTDTYRRTLRACNRCRSKKIRCDLGSLGDPQPACAKCRRAQEECVIDLIPVVRFENDNLSKRDSNQAFQNREDRKSMGGEGLDLHILPHKRQKTDVSNEINCMMAVNIDCGVSTQKSSSNRLLSSLDSSSPLEEGDKLLLNSRSTHSYAPTASCIVETVVHDDADALHLLFDTALHEGSRNSHRCALSPGPHTRGHAHRRPSDSSMMRESTPQVQSKEKNGLAKDPRLSEEEQASLWSHFPPCVQHYLSPAEAMAYLDYFFRVLNKQMPIFSDWFHKSENLQALLTEEPVLCYAILTISSRYFNLSGYNGHSRGLLLHEHFFKSMQEGLHSLMWGFPLGRRSGLTAVGAIESLLLLTQWQPRGLSLQPILLTFSGTATNADYVGNDPERDRNDATARTAFRTTLRFDAMCWRLTNLAVSLALEIGMFGDGKSPSGRNICSGEDTRVPHIERILYIYIAGLAARLRRQNPLSDIPWSRLMKQHKDSTNLTQCTEWPEIFSRWAELIDLGNVANQALQTSRHATRNQAKDLKPHGIIRHFSRSLSHWWEEFQSLQVPEPFCYNMELLYHYHRILIHSVSLHAHVTLKPPATQLQSESSDDMPQAEMQNLVASCYKVYEIVIELHARQALRTIPGPLLLRLITMSIFVLKVIALSPVETNDLLAILNRAIIALRDASVDDLHLVGYFAELLGHVLQKTVRTSRNVSVGLEAENDNQPLVPDPERADNDASHLSAHNSESLDVLASFDDWDDWFSLTFDANLAANGEHAFHGLL